MRRPLLLLLLLIPAAVAEAQPKDPHERYYTFAISNSHSAKPFGSFTSLVYEDFHPGLDVGYCAILKNKNDHQWFAEMHLSYMFHRWVQHNIALCINGGYRYKVTGSWSAEIKAGGGYQLSIADSKIFEITETDGPKKKANFGRSQVVGNVGLAVSKCLSPPSGTRIFMEYQQRIQAPFINEYVPILPYNSLLLGVAIPVH